MNTLSCSDILTPNAPLISVMAVAAILACGTPLLAAVLIQLPRTPRWTVSGLSAARPCRWNLLVPMLHTLFTRTGERASLQLSLSILASSQQGQAAARRNRILQVLLQVRVVPPELGDLLLELLPQASAVSGIESKEFQRRFFVAKRPGALTHRDNPGQCTITITKSQLTKLAKKSPIYLNQALFRVEHDHRLVSDVLRAGSKL